MYKYLPTDREHILVYGRTTDANPLPLFWTAGGIEFSTRSTEVYVELEADYDGAEEWVEFIVDGCLYQRFIVSKGKNEYCIFRGMYEHELKLVNVRMSSQAMPEDSVRKLLIHSITCDEELEPVKPKDYRFEFIGDSLTSGEGLTGAQHINSWCPTIFGLAGHYALLTSQHFNAEHSIVSQSGWGVYCGWDNNIRSNIPTYYEQICGVINGDENIKLGAHDSHDFASWKPDVIVINLGTNDGGSLNQPAWKDPDTGIEYKQSRDDSGKLTPDSKEHFDTAVVTFLKKIRKNNPDAYMVWAYGMCDHTMENEIKDALQIYLDETQDAKLDFVLLPVAKEEWLGAHGHPGVKDHAASAEVLISHLENNKNKWS